MQLPPHFKKKKKKGPCEVDVIIGGERKGRSSGIIAQASLDDKHATLQRLSCKMGPFMII